MKARPWRPIGVQVNFAIVVPDKAFDRLARRKRFMPIVNSGGEMEVLAKPAQDFGSYPKIGKNQPRIMQKNADQICVFSA
jgi:hypothetical protein